MYAHGNSGGVVVAVHGCGADADRGFVHRSFDLVPDSAHRYPTLVVFGAAMSARHCAECVLWNRISSNSFSAA
jgi:hypothetical protein